MRRTAIWCCILTLACFTVQAGDPDSPGPPNTTAGHMPTLQELYDYLMSGTLPAPPAPFQEPAAGPGGTMKTLLQIYSDMRALLDQVTVAETEVLSGRKYFSTSPAGWGIWSGTMPDNGAVAITPGVAAQTIPAGYHDGLGTVAGDADLTGGNIRNGVTIFGVAGTYSGGGCTCSGTLVGTRWCDNGDGTVTDLLGSDVMSGKGKCLVWLKEAGFLALQSWCDANSLTSLLSAADPLAELTDGSVAGDWRVPTLLEMQALTSGTEAVRMETPRAFTGVGLYYWSYSSSSISESWLINLSNGEAWTALKDYEYGVWPIRSGP
ncbi:MAG: hypothetical protein KA419_10255 [Acidobacteria bacterium]|nr:hypothetical protein [Acidobacteriota bacterium]